eukprot:GEMP01008688.1.p1 GENE.GEMP01008688.1~~GEMP01008688.1.p1  ORF type:complete len:511 (+),score=118.55 GEMP01008688.1:62-1534(+)
MGRNRAPTHDDGDSSSIGHRITNDDKVEKYCSQRGSLDEMEILARQTLPESEGCAFELRCDDGSLSLQQSTSQLDSCSELTIPLIKCTNTRIRRTRAHSKISDRPSSLCASVTTERFASASPIMRPQLSIYSEKLPTRQTSSSTCMRGYASVPSFTKGRQSLSSSYSTHMASTSTPSTAALTPASSPATPTPQSRTSTKRRSRREKERVRHSATPSPSGNRSSRGATINLHCLIVCALLLLASWYYITTDSDVSAGGEFSVGNPRYRRYGSAACVHADNFTAPTVQRRLRAALLGFPRDDVVRTLLHDLAVMPHLQSGWRHEAVYTTVLSDTDSSARWYFTAKGKLSRRDGEGDGNDGTVCVALGGVEVRAETEERDNNDGEKQLWTWMERTAWKITDAAFKRTQVKHPWVLPCHLLPTSAQRWCEILSLDLLPARLQRGLACATTYALERLHVRIQFASSMWTYTKSSMHTYASSFLAHNARSSLWTRA